MEEIPCNIHISVSILPKTPSPQVFRKVDCGKEVIGEITAASQGYPSFYRIPLQTQVRHRTVYIIGARDPVLTPRSFNVFLISWLRFMQKWGRVAQSDMVL